MILITGAGGFPGRQLCAQLIDRDIVGADLERVAAAPGVRWRPVEDTAALCRVIDELRPATIVHAAFRNRIPAGWSAGQYVAEAAGDSEQVSAAAARAGAQLLL